MDQMKEKAAGAIALTVGAAAVLTGCGNGAGQAAAARMQKPEVKVQAGASEDYMGVAAPTLNTVYVQSDADARKYDPIMKEILENGIDTERELQTGL